MLYKAGEKRKYIVPDFELPVMAEDCMGKKLNPKVVSFETYLHTIADTFRRLSPQQRIRARELKLKFPPVPVRFESKTS